MTAGTRGVPHVPTARRRSAGARSTTSAPEARGKKAERARPAEQRPQPGELVEREDAREHVEERGPREDPAQ